MNCSPGVWYVFPGINDASEQVLPWRVPTRTELAKWMARYPEAKAWRDER